MQCAESGDSLNAIASKYGTNQASIAATQCGQVPTCLQQASGQVRKHWSPRVLAIGRSGLHTCLKVSLLQHASPSRALI